jgi:CrcB protein
MTGRVLMLCSFAFAPVGVSMQCNQAGVQRWRSLKQAIWIPRPEMTFDRWLLIAVGGAVGAVARYALASWAQQRLGAAAGVQLASAGPHITHFPWGTLCVNMAGCVLLGLLAGANEAATLDVRLRDLLAIGLLGAFTTFSTFSLEGVHLLRHGHWAMAGGYLAASVFGGLALAGGGFWLGRSVVAAVAR